MSDLSDLRIVSAAEADVPTILRLIRALADYERMSSAVTATAQDLRERLFGANPVAEVAIGYVGDEPAGIAVFFHSFSTFLGRSGIYLEDIFVEEQHRGRGLGKGLMQYVAQLAVERGCARLEWAVLNWNAPAIGFYQSLEAKPQDEWTVYRLTGKPLARLAAQRT